MLEKHTGRKLDGTVETKLIAQMSDEHLNNMIQKVLKRVLKMQEAKQEGVTDFHRELYDLPTVDDKSIARATREALQRLYPYFSEAYLRNLEGPRLMLIKVLGREEAVPDFEGVPQLPGRLPDILGDIIDDEDLEVFDG